MKIANSAYQRSLPLLVGGDVVAFVLWVIVGLGSHHMTSNWLFNVVRVVAPFLLGWFAVAPFVGAYQVSGDRRGFLLRSALAWLVGTAIGLLLRATLFGSGFNPSFAAVTIVVTGVFVMGWRTAFALLLNR